ncbi:unnamed protein product [Gadus morhua 'NCC']
MARPHHHSPEHPLVIAHLKDRSMEGERLLFPPSLFTSGLRFVCSSTSSQPLVLWNSVGGLKDTLPSAFLKADGIPLRTGAEGTSLLMEGSTGAATSALSEAGKSLRSRLLPLEPLLCLRPGRACEALCSP